MFCYVIGFVVVGSGLLVRNTCFLEVCFQISIDKLAYFIITERSWVSLRFSIDLFTDSFDEGSCIRFLMQEIRFEVAYLVFDKG